MRSGAAWLMGRRSFQFGVLLTIWFGVASGLVGSQAASAFSFDEAIERCRQTVGRPIVRACM